MTDADIEGLRHHGWNDDQVTIAAQVIGYFNYITRIAQGLGVAPEPWMQVPRDQWLNSKADLKTELGS
ncbi:MAG TPA: hypothetical protein DCY79_08755 [Planctomycetaceae bacterium]|nr:hypothetical protein [Blastopirellula sp.]HAY79879.1 hypothetical protein [Planctomycetaceae bacterium]